MSKEIPDNKFAEVIKKIADDAVAYAAEAVNITLDYTGESINRLETDVMTFYANALKDKEAGVKAYINWAITFGAYLGETLLRNHDYGYYWVQDENGWPSLKKGDRNMIYPATKVYKRLYNGAESGDSVSGFYDASIQIMAETATDA